jgi:hypothetical protein
VKQVSGAETKIVVPYLGDNGFIRANVGVRNVVSVTIMFAGQGAVTDLKYSLCDQQPTKSPTKSPSKFPTKTPSKAPLKSPISPTKAPLVSVPVSNPIQKSVCPLPKAFELTFDDAEVGLKNGDYITSQLAAKYFVNVFAKAKYNGYTPNNAARVVDSAKPPHNDLDLGSPNQHCTGGGPGVGHYGAPYKPYPNCKALGNMLIIQKQNSENIDDVHDGGNITFTFTGLAEVKTVGILDVDDTNTKIIVSACKSVFSDEMLSFF